MKGLAMSDIERELKALGDRVSQRPGVLPPAEDIVRRARLRKFGAGLTSLALIAVAGFGGVTAVRAFAGRSGDDLGRPSVLAAAAAATEAAGTARAEFEMSTKSEGGVPSMEIRMSGSVDMDFEANRSHTTLEMEGGPFAGFGTSEIIQDDGTMYVKAGGADPDKWVRTTSSSVLGGAMGTLSGTSSPDAYLEQLKAISDDVEVVGTDEIDGVSTTHYRATIDLEGMMSQLTYADERVQDVMDRGGIELDPMQVWVDPDGLVRKMTFGSEMDMGETTMQMDFSMRFYDFGAAIDIEIPDPDDVVEEEEASLGAIFGGGAIAKKGITKHPIETTLLMTRERYSGPLVTIQESELLGSMCIHLAPRWVRIAHVVERASGESVALMAEITQSNSFTESENKRIICQHQVGDVSELKKHPNRFELKLVGTGRNQTVGFALAQKILEPDE